MNTKNLILLSMLSITTFGLSACNSGSTSPSSTSGINQLSFSQGVNGPAYIQTSTTNGSTFANAVSLQYYMNGQQIITQNTFAANISSNGNIITIDEPSLTNSVVLTSANGIDFSPQVINWASYDVSDSLGSLAQVNTNTIFAVTDNTMIPNHTAQDLIAMLEFESISQTWSATAVDTSNFSPAPLTALDGNNSGYLVAFGASDFTTSPPSSHLYAPLQDGNGNWIYTGSSPFPSLGTHILNYAGESLPGAKFNLNTPDSGLLCAKTLVARCVAWGGNFIMNNSSYTAPGVFMVYYNESQGKSIVQQFVSTNSESSTASLVNVALNKNATAFIGLDSSNKLWAGIWDANSNTGVILPVQLVSATGSSVSFAPAKVYTSNLGFIVVGNDGASYLLNIAVPAYQMVVATANQLSSQANLNITQLQQIFVH